MEAVRQKAIKGYELKEKIGTGGFGAVYRAQQTTVGREVAIKVILPALASQADFIRRFEGEAQLVAKLEHPHITPLYDYWRDPEGAYLVMRWLRGGSLRDALEKGRFELRSAALLLEQIAGALSLAHRNGIIHRDIKPANILLDEDGNAYLTDFGIAKDLSINSSGTQPDMIVGSLDYISPEQARSETVSSRTDIYSLGVTLYEMIVGEHPFGNLSAIERLYKHINDPLPEITGFDNAADINRVIQKATAKNPEQRYPDALAFAADFREAIGMNRTSTSVVEILTQREQEILQLIIEGLSNKEIAQKLTVTHGTVKWYVNQIYEKLGVRSRVQAMVRARELNLVVKGNENLDNVHRLTEEFQAENPYKGLRAFQSADYQDFFGREKLTAKLLKRIVEKGDYSRFLAIVGPSGSGKSSLAKAGLIPALWRGELPGSEKWFIVEMTPSSRPIDELEIALTKLAANQAGNLHEHLQRDAHGLLRAANLILPNDGSELLLAIDQFEEVFTLSEDEAARKHFLDLLYAAVNDVKSRVRVIITLRADFYDRPLHYTNFGEMLKSRLETILPLSAEELERAISKPAERVGVIFEAGLVSSMVADMNYQAGALPLLQYALTELFERRKGRLLSREAYEAMGKSTGALAKRADETYEGFDEAGKMAAKQLFLRLVMVTDGMDDTRRRASRGELLGLGDADIMEEVIDAFASYRLLTLDNEPLSREPVVEVAHEAILREWERLRDWLRESREDLRIHRQVAGMSKDWADSKQEKSFLARGSRLECFEEWVDNTELLMTGLERSFIIKSIEARELELEKEAQQIARESVLKRRSVRFMRLLIAVLTMALLGAFALAGYVMNERNQAEAERDNATSLALASGAQLSLREGDVETAVSLAVAANQIAEPSFLAERVLYDVSTGYGVRSFIPNLPNTRFAAIALRDDDQVLAAVSEDGTISLWNTNDTQLLFTTMTIEPSDRAFLNFSHDNRFLLISSQNLEHDSECVIRDATSGQEITRLDSPEYIWNCAHFLRGNRVFLWGRVRSSNIGVLGIWDFSTGEVIAQIVSDIDAESRFTAVADPSGEVAIISRNNFQGYRTLLRWDLLGASRDPVNLNRTIPITETQLFASPTAQQYVQLNTGTTWLSNEIAIQNNMNILDIRTDEGISGESRTYYLAVDFSANGRTLITSDAQNRIVVRDVVTGEMYNSFSYPSAVSAVSYSQQYFVTKTNDGLRIWEFGSGLQETVLPSGLVNGIFVSSDGSLLAVAQGTTIQSYRLVNGEYERLPHLFYRATSLNASSEVELSNDARFLVSRYQLVWTVSNIETGEQVAIPNILGESARFSPDASLVMILQHIEQSADRLHIADRATGNLLRTLEVDTYSLSLNPFAISDNNRNLFVGLENGQIGVWNIETGEMEQELEGDGSPIYALSLGAGMTKIYAATQNGNLIIWDLASGNQLRFFERVGNVREIQVSSDEQRLSVTLIYGGLRILDANYGTVTRNITIGDPSRIPSVLDDGSAVIYVSETNSIVRQELLLNGEDLMSWVLDNRYVAPLRCDQLALYQIEPLCNQ